MTEAAHLKNLSSVKSDRGVKFLTPAASPGSHCPLHNALMTAGGIKGLSSLTIGTPECGIYSRALLPEFSAGDKALHWVYELDSREVVFGARTGIINALKKMDREGAKAILVIATCVPELFGEDMEGILNELQPQITARLSFAAMGHFKCNGPGSGSRKVLSSMVHFMKKGTVRRERINILGRSPDAPRHSLPRLLSALEKRGFHLRFLASGASLEDFQTAPDAALNLVVSPYAQELAIIMEKMFRTFHVALYPLYAVADIDEAYGLIARRLNITFDNEFKPERRDAVILQKQAKNALTPIRYVLLQTEDVSPLPLVNYFAAFGMRPLLLHLDEFYPADQQWSKIVVDKGIDPPVCHIANEEIDLPLIERFSSDLIIGNLHGRGNTDNFAGQIGYERTVGILKSTLRAATQLQADSQEVQQ